MLPLIAIVWYPLMGWIAIEGYRRQVRRAPGRCQPPEAFGQECAAAWRAAHTGASVGTRGGQPPWV